MDLASRGPAFVTGPETKPQPYFYVMAADGSWVDLDPPNMTRFSTPQTEDTLIGDVLARDMDEAYEKVEEVRYGVRRRAAAAHRWRDSGQAPVPGRDQSS